MRNELDLKAYALIENERTGKLFLEYPWEDREAYALWLAQTYQMVNHSTRLVALAGGLAPLDQNSLHARFVDHSKEERGHQLIAVADLKAMGYRVEDLPALYQAVSMYQIQYYWIQHRGVTSFFGYTLALELLGSTYASEAYRRTLAAHGDKATKFLKCHAEDDVDHIQKAFAQIEKLSPPEQALVRENLELSSNLYRGMLNELRAYLAAGRTLKRAA